MSALLPKVAAALADQRVRFGPTADIIKLAEKSRRNQTSWPQQEFAQHRAAFEHLMRPRRVGKRQAVMDARMKLAGRQHVDERAHSSAAFVDEVVPRVDGELSYRRRVLAHLWCRQQIERRLAPKRAVNDERPARCEHCDIVGKTRSGDWIDDGLNAPTTRDLLDPLADLLILAVDNMIGAKIAGEARRDYVKQ
jgi:hypothetical protein